ncbi:MAG TPA: DolP-mannose mannosyltransferase [Blastocatellia bacterium]|nr:DolP-mannose mannosyltransferase [Blastocatellia bacterium]
MSDVAAMPRLGVGRQTIRDRLAWFDRRRLFWIVLVAGGLVYSQTQFWNQPSGGDHANWDYFAQVIARGGVPYRDVVNIKSPLSAYIGAAAILVGRPFGLGDVLAIRITFLALALLTLGFTFLVALDYFKSIRIALFTATVMLTFDAFARFNGGGIQPKTAMLLFGLVTLWAIDKDRPLTAGVFGMLSALTWQPGLLFVGAAGLAFSRYLTSWRDRKALKMLAGAVIPLGILLAYFWVSGALESFYLWNIHFNATVYAPHESRSLENFFTHLSELLNGRYHNSRDYSYVALAGLCLAISQEFRNAIKHGGRYLLERASTHVVIIAPLVYFGFCMIDIQNGPDLIPLIPFVAIFAAVAIEFVVEQTANFFSRARKNGAAIEGWASVAIVGFILYRNVCGAYPFERGFPTLKDQDPAVEEITSHLEPGDKMFVYGRTEILVLSGLTSISKYFLLDRGKARYLDQVEPGGFDGWIERLKAEHPKIVVLGRLGAGDARKPLEDWVAAEYELRINRVFAYYIRKDSRNR